MARSRQTELSRSSQWVASHAPASSGGAHQAKPNRTTAAARPASQLDQAAGDEVHRDRQRRAGHAQVEVAGRGQVAAEGRVLEVAHAGRPHAGLGEPVVQPGGGPVAQVGADRLVDRDQHLEQHEHHPDGGQRPGQVAPALDGADQRPGGDGEHRRQHPPAHQHHPPGDGQAGVGLEQGAEEAPLLAFAQPGDGALDRHGGRQPTGASRPTRNRQAGGRVQADDCSIGPGGRMVPTSLAARRRRRRLRRGRPGGRARHRARGPATAPTGRWW